MIDFEWHGTYRLLIDVIKSNHFLIVDMIISTPTQPPASVSLGLCQNAKCGHKSLSVQIDLAFYYRVSPSYITGESDPSHSGTFQIENSWFQFAEKAKVTSNTYLLTSVPCLHVANIPFSWKSCILLFKHVLLRLFISLEGFSIIVLKFKKVSCCNCVLKQIEYTHWAVEKKKKYSGDVNRYCSP